MTAVQAPNNPTASVLPRPTADIAHLIVGTSPGIRAVRALIERVARTPVPVLITGPTGVGKDMVARAIHTLSGRRHIAAVNVCAVAETMLEATLFGHVRGAFTGAHSDGPGYFAEADRGTLFLDEIGSLSLAAQAKLLRAIETKDYRPVGAKADRHSDFRLISATHEDLSRLVERGDFRRDLSHRLGAFIVHVPALADRLEDLPALVAHLLREDQSWSGIPVYADAGANALLSAQPWPGNVRQLRHVLQAAVILCEDGRLRAGDVERALGLSGAQPVVHFLDTQERAELVAVLERCAWDTARAASMLGIHRATVYRRMEQLHIVVRRAASRRASDGEARLVAR